MSARYRDPRYPTSIRLDGRMRTILRDEAERQRRSVSELIDFILHEWAGRMLKKKTRTVRPRRSEATPDE